MQSTQDYTAKEFYYTQDKLKNWNTICFCEVFLIVLYALNMFINAPDFNRIGFWILISVFAISFYFHHKHYTTPMLVFYSSFVLIKNKKYRYVDIENFWVGSGYVYIARCGSHFTESPKVLYIKTKNKSKIYRFDLENRFSLADSDAILEQLRIHKVANYTSSS